MQAARKVGLGRVELPTSPLSGVRSSQLSYRPGQCAGPSKLDGSARDDRDAQTQQSPHKYDRGDIRKHRI